MKPPLKLNAIDQEHLQELYDSLGTARDELPYTPKFDELEQGFAALLKYVRSSSNASSEQQAVVEISDDQLKQLKIILSRHLTGGKILPYSDEMNSARTEFKKMAK